MRHKVQSNGSHEELPTGVLASTGEAPDFEPELGQDLRDDQWLPYAVPAYVKALVIGLAEETRRVDYNARQRKSLDSWDGYHPTQEVVVGGLTWRPHWWGDEDDVRADLPNLQFQDVEIRWYKNLGRSMSTNVQKTADQWVAWFNAGMLALERMDTARAQTR